MFFLVQRACILCCLKGGFTFGGVFLKMKGLVLQTQVAK